MRLFRSVLTLSSSMIMASALDMVVDTATMICDNRPVKVSFSYVCNTENVCTFGQQEYVKGTLTYDGIVDIYNATNTEYMYVDASLNLELGGVKTFERKLVNFVQIPICSSFSANEYNMYGDCPSDGRYLFDTSYRIPAQESGFMEWITSGYSGEVVLDIYLRNDLVGRCVVGTKTLVSGSYNKSTMTPSGKIGAIMALLAIGLLIAFVVFRVIKACRTKRKARKTIPVEDSIQGDTSSMTYRRMNDCEECGDISHKANDVVIDPRYMSTGPVI